MIDLLGDIILRLFKRKFYESDLSKIIDWIQWQIQNEIREEMKGGSEKSRDDFRIAICARLCDEVGNFTEEHLSSGDDPNLAFMWNLSAAVNGWLSFILKAKSMDNRRTKTDRARLHKACKRLKKCCLSIINYGFSYGEVYDKTGGFDAHNPEKQRKC